MKLEEVVAKFEELYPKRFKAFYYDMTIQENGSQEAKVRLYLDPNISHRPVNTWAEALKIVKLNERRESEGLPQLDYLPPPAPEALPEDYAANQED